MNVPGPIAFSPDGGTLAVVGNDPVIELHSLATHQVIARLECPLPITVRWLAFTPDGERLLFPNPKGHIVHCWDLGVVREQLTAIGLDWDLPPHAPIPSDGTAPRLRAEVDLGTLAP
jgi:WD40 repeat protein